MKKTVVNRMTEETIAMTMPILDSIFADAVNHIIISRRRINNLEIKIIITSNMRCMDIWEAGVLSP